MRMRTAPDAKGSSTIPRTVWALGFVSLFMDISSEMIHALLPLFLTGTLGASVAFVGLIEGVAESTASIAKIFSGYLSDRFGRRKPFIFIGYSLGALSKPFFAIAGSPLIILGARFADRIGKGIRGAPRDALVADVTPEPLRGRAYGLRQTLDTVGAFVGPLLAVLLMALFANDFRMVFWLAVIPGAIAAFLVLIGVEDREIAPREAARQAPIRIEDLQKLSLSFWGVVVLGVIFTLARFSEAFLVLKAHQEGLPLELAPFVLVSMNIVYSLGAYPAGAWSDRAPPHVLLIWGLATLVGADLLLAFAPGIWGSFAGIALWGAHMALTQGLLAKLVAEHAPEALRGSAFGLFNLASGLAMLAASVIAGLLWDGFGPTTTFLAGAVFAGVSAVLIAVHRFSSGFAAVPFPSYQRGVGLEGEGAMLDNHRQAAIAANARVWALLEKTGRSASEAEEMVHAAHASHWHWLHAGTGKNWQRGEWLIARVYTALGLREPARRHAGRMAVLTRAHAAELEDFDFAFEAALLARVAALEGDMAQARRNYDTALSLGQALGDEEDRKIFFVQLKEGDWFGFVP